MNNLTFIIFYSNTSIAFESVIICLQILGVLLNLVFISVTRKDSKKPADFTQIHLSSIQIVLSVVTCGEVTFDATRTSADIDQHWLLVLDTLEFWCKASYVWLSVYLITARFKVIKNIKTVSGSTKRVHKSCYHQLIIFGIVTLVVSVRSLVTILDISKNIRRTSFRYLSLAFLTIPLTIFCIMNFLLIVKTAIFVYDRYVKKRARSYSTGDDLNGDSVTDKLVKQVIYSLLFHTLFMMVPYLCLVTIDTLMWTKVIQRDTLVHYGLFRLLTQALLPLLNPMSLGILLKQHRKVLASFLVIKKLSSIISSTRVYPTVVMNEPLQTIHESGELDQTEQVIATEPRFRRRLSIISRKDIPLRSLTKFSLAQPDPMFLWPSDKYNEQVVVVDLHDIHEESDIFKRRGTGFSTISVLSSHRSRDRLSVRSVTSSGFDVASLGSTKSRNLNSVSSAPFRKPPSLEHSISMISNASTESAIQDTILYF